MQYRPGRQRRRPIDGWIELVSLQGWHVHFGLASTYPQRQSEARTWPVPACPVARAPAPGPQQAAVRVQCPLTRARAHGTRARPGPGLPHDTRMRAALAYGRLRPPI